MPRTIFFRRALSIAVTLAASACGGRASSSTASADGGLPDPCLEYLDVYTRCMRHLSPENPEVAAERTASARTALARITDARKLSETCLDATSQLRTSCQ